jgi:hypothetical protein
VATKAPTREPLTAEAFLGLFRTFTDTAFRCEQQRQYVEDGVRDTYARFLAGNPQPPTELPDFRDWYALIAEQTAAGKVIERVRIHDDPPTDYQRWVRWVGQWNEQAGEIMHYVTRQDARDLGFLPDDPRRDWWLFDDNHLVLMTFDPEGHRIHTELVTDEEAIMQARAWRYLAVRHTRGENTGDQPNH